MSLNAHSPTVVGTEWFPTRQRGLRVSSTQRQAAVLTPGATATDDIAVYLRGVSGSPVLTCEIIKVSDITAASAVTTTDTFRPSADLNVSNAEHAGGGTSAPFYVDVDESSLSLVDYMANNAATTSTWIFNVASGGFSTGRRVLGVTIHMVVQCGSSASPLVITPTYQAPGGAAHTLPAQFVPFSSGVTTISATWDTNPATGAPWTVADVTALASTGGVGFVSIAPTAALGIQLYQAWVTVDWVTETRLATGTATVTADGWTTFSMATPTGTDTWTPTAATSYAVILSTPTVNAQCSWAALDSGTAHPDIASASVTVTGGYPSALGETDTAAPAVVGVNTSGVAIWGQPERLLSEEAVYTGRVLQQEVTLPDTASRGWVKFVARQQSVNTTAALTVRLKRRSDGVQVGGDMTVNPFDVRDEPRLLQIVSKAAASGAAGTAVQHYLEFTSTATSGDGWLLATVSSTDPTATEKLSTDSRGIESDVGTWSATTANTAITSSPTVAHTGTKSLSLQYTTAGNADIEAATATGASGFAVIPGLSYIASGWTRHITTSRTHQLSLSFYTSGGVLISTTVVATQTSTTSFAQMSGSMAAPATAAFAALRWKVVGAAQSPEVHYGDDFSVTEYGPYAGLSGGGNTDTATIDGVETPGTDIPILVGTTRTSPADQTVVSA